MSAAALLAAPDVPLVPPDGVLPDGAAGAASVPHKCVVSGLDSSILTGNAPCTFKITAHSADGSQRDKGGDAFFVHVRGAERVRARVADKGDGTYEISWKPTISGKYKIAVSLFGVALKGSPFVVLVNDPLPHPPKCEARGDALHRITARMPSSFEIRYRDRAGLVTPAIELDVYVVPVPYDLPSPVEHTAWDIATQASDGGAAPIRVAKAEGDGDEHSFTRAVRPPLKLKPKPMAAVASEKASQRSGGTMTPKAAGNKRGTARSSKDDIDEEDTAVGSPGGDEAEEEAEEEAAEEEADELISLKDNVSRRQRAFPIQVGSHPLRARKRPERGSDPLGVQLEPEQLATVLEEHISSDGLNVQA